MVEFIGPGGQPAKLQLPIRFGPQHTGEKGGPIAARTTGGSAPDRTIAVRNAPGNAKMQSGDGGGQGPDATGDSKHKEGRGPSPASAGGQEPPRRRPPTDRDLPEPSDESGRPEPERPDRVHVVSEPLDRLTPFAPLPTPMPDVPPHFWDVVRDLDLDSVKTRTHLGQYSTNPANPQRLFEDQGGAGHGLVVEAASPENNLVAVKISKSSSPTATDVFSREAMLHRQAAEATDKVPAFVEAGTLALPSLYRGAMDTDRAFATIVTDFIPGENLLERNFGALPIAIPEAVEQYGPLAEGIDAIGRAGIVHRDIKPSNVLVNRQGELLLTDFGVATTVGARPDEAFGAPPRRAPEQAIPGNPVTEATNAFQFGILVLDAVVRHETLIPLVDLADEEHPTYEQLLESGRFTQHLHNWMETHHVPRRWREPFYHVLAESPSDIPTAVEFIQELDQSYTH